MWRRTLKRPWKYVRTKRASPLKTDLSCSPERLVNRGALAVGLDIAEREGLAEQHLPDLG